MMDGLFLVALSADDRDAWGRIEAFILQQLHRIRSLEVHLEFLVHRPEQCGLLCIQIVEKAHRKLREQHLEASRLGRAGFGLTASFHQDHHV